MTLLVFGELVPTILIGSLAFVFGAVAPQLVSPKIITVIKVVFSIDNMPFEAVRLVRL